MKTYYQDEFATIYHGDCREVLPSLVLEGDAVLVTDPPYGVGLGTSSEKRTGTGRLPHARYAGYASFEDTYENFVAAVVPGLNAALDRCVRGAVFTGPHIHEQRKPEAIGGVYCPSGSGRNVWGFKTFLPVLFYGKAPELNRGCKPIVIQSSEVPEREGNPHPVPKPLGWMAWLVGLTSRPGEVVIDPFMGSGTTLRAAKDLGRKVIGIELEEKYCAVAVKRLAQECLFGGAA